MPRKGGLHFYDSVLYWTPDTSDLAVLYEWIGRELELRNNRASDLVSTKPSKPYRKLKKVGDAVTLVRPTQASQQAVIAGKDPFPETGEWAPWETGPA